MFFKHLLSLNSGFTHPLRAPSIAHGHACPWHQVTAEKGETEAQIAVKDTYAGTQVPTMPQHGSKMLPCPQALDENNS